MIKERNKKIYFVAHNQPRGRVKDTSAPPTVNINTKFGRMQFGKPALIEMGMMNRFVRFYLDPVQKIIGWKTTDKIPDGELKLWKIVKPSTNGQYAKSVKTMLQKMQGSKNLKEKYMHLEVQKYREAGLMTAPNDVYYFVELKDNDTV